MDKFSNGKPYKVIAFCLAGFMEYDQIAYIQELAGKCSKNRIKVIIFSTLTCLYDDEVTNRAEGQMFKLADISRFDALVIMSESIKQLSVTRELVERAKAANVPVISIDNEIEGCINVCFGYINVFEKICRHIIEDHGIKKVNFIAGVKGNPFSEERLECYKRVLEENGIKYEPERVGYGDFWAEPTKSAVENFLKSDLEMPEAIICANDIMAIECMRTLKAYGYSIPQDIVVTGFDGVDLEQYYSPRLTTAEFDIDGLGTKLVEIINNIEEYDVEGSKIVIDYRYREGASCGCKELSTENVEEKLYEEKFIVDDLKVFLREMNMMISKLGNYEELNSIFKQLPQYFARTLCKECWICFNYNFIDDNSNIEWNFNMKEEDYLHYTDTMRVTYHALRGQVDDATEVNRYDLLPDIDRVLCEDNFIMFVPIHIQGCTVGYAASTFDAYTMMYTYYYHFILNFRHVLEMYINRAAQERLFVSDALTKIFNRHGFYRNIDTVIHKSRKYNIPFTIISIDMDGLKQINDTYGHAEGDFAIRTIAESMACVSCKEEICSRFGGDEFVIAFADARGEERAKEIIDGIESILNSYNDMHEKPYQIRASFGVASKIAGKDIFLDEFIRIADDMMYANKKERKKSRQ